MACVLLACRAIIGKTRIQCKDELSVEVGQASFSLEALQLALRGSFKALEGGASLLDQLAEAQGHGPHNPNFKS
jgi:hypothetical protein